MVVCLELLCDTFVCSHLLYQPREHFLCLPVDVGKVTVQFAVGEQGCIRINKTLAQVRGETVVNPPKTPKSNRVVSVPRFILALIRDYADRLVDYEPQDRLFYFTKHFLHYELAAGCKASGVKRIRVHDLRHSHASLLVEMGFSPLLISERLGHENIQTTLQTYSHLYPDKQEEVSSRLESDEGEKYSGVLSEFEKKIEDMT